LNRNCGSLRAAVFLWLFSPQSRREAEVAQRFSLRKLRALPASAVNREQGILNDEENERFVAKKK